jgi:tRNA (5-methylaminomethyl-2-thiouridylate)-methyltransferase
MNNWDVRDEGFACTANEDFISIEKTCKVLGISKVHQVNYQRPYWQRVFMPLLDGYSTGTVTPNPDILCNREIKFGELFEWSMGRADFLATGHYARILNGELRQARDIGKDQTYFLAAINRSCLSSTIFPVGNLMKSDIKSTLLAEASLNHLMDRKESMGICFIGKRKKFKKFISEFVPDSISGPMINLDSGLVYENHFHSGLASYTLGQKVAIGGVRNKLYVGKKDLDRNALLVVDRLDHPSLWSDKIYIKNCEKLTNSINGYSCLYCSIRSVDKRGSKVRKIEKLPDRILVELEDRVFAPCEGQWAVFYAEDSHASTNDMGRICIGGSEIIS